METKIFTVYDAKAEAYLQPFFARNEGVAQRMFHQASLDEEHDFCRHAEDYTLFEMGVWNEDEGTIKMYEAMRPLGNALQFKRPVSLVEETGS